MMLNFKEFSSRRDNTINEGGNAIKVSSRINQENVEATLQAIYKKVLVGLFGLKKDEYALLGSTGKKLPGSSSGDIDIAVSIRGLMRKAEKSGVETSRELIDWVAQTLKKHYEHIYVNIGGGIVSFGFEIVNADGKQEGQIVQVDLMLTDNIKFASWMFFSPHEKDSPWKGLYRNRLISAITHYADRVGNDEEWERFKLNYQKGIDRVIETRKGKRGILKNPKVVKVIPLGVKDPDKIVEILFGDYVTAKDILTYEDVMRAIMSEKFKWKKYRKQIAKLAVKYLTKDGYTVPEDLKALAG